MDQRVKGGSPPKTTVDTTSASKSSDKDPVPEKKRKGGSEEENGDKGAVLELLIEGRCGTMGDQQLQISGRETSCPEGNVRLRIGLQAKRTKKPPKILESYVCKPTIRTYQRQGRGALLKGEAEGGVGQQSKTSSSPDEATSREQHSGLDSVQTTSKQTTSAPPPSSLSTSSSTLQPLSSAATTPASAIAPVSQGTKTPSQVPIKLADKAEVIPNGTLEKVKKANGQSVTSGNKNSTPKADGTSQTPPPQTPPTEEIKNEASSSKKHNGLVQTSKQKRLSNGKSTADTINSAPSSKKSGKHSSSSSISKHTPATTDSQKELSNKSKSPSISTVTGQPEESTTISHAQDASNPLMQPSPGKKKAKKSKKEKRRDKKSKRDRLEAERAKSQSRSEESKKRKEKVRDEKPRHGKEKEEKHRNEVENGKNFDHESQTTEHNNTKNTDNASGGTVEEDMLIGSADEQSKANDNCKTVKEVDPGATTGDVNKSKEQDISKHSSVPPSQTIPTVPGSLLATPSRDTLSTPSFPSEQDSRPLKKRKSRRPSWTRLVHRAHKAENHEATMDSQHNPSLSFPQNPKTTLNPKPTDESHAATSSSVTNSSSPRPAVTRSPSPKQNHPNLEPCPVKNPLTAARKRGRPKSQSSSSNETPLKLLSNATPTEVPLPGQDRAPSPVQQSATVASPSPRKRGRPPKHPLPDDRSQDALNQGDRDDRRKSISVSEKGNRQLNIKRLINEMRKRKKRRFHKVMSSGFVAKMAQAKSIDATTVHTLSALSTSLGGKLGPQINVSKRGTIYMGKRRGRKPKAQTSNSQSSTQSSLFTSTPETSLFSSVQPQPPPSHPFPSPSLTHSSGAQSPYSEGSLADPTPCLLFSQPFSLPSPSSSCTSPRPPSSSSLTSFVRKSCPCQGRQHFPFHQSTCKLSSPTPPLHHTPGSPGHLKEATTSPRSESHSEETLPSDSGIGTDNNSISERAEMRGNRAMLRIGHTSGIILGAQKHPTSILDHPSHPSPVSPPLPHISRHPNPNALSVDRHRDRHRHRRREFECSSSCMCLCACPGHSKCTNSDFYSCHGHNALKRQKNKHKKKHQQHILMQDPEFVAELEDMIAQFNEIHIGRKSWARSGIGQAYEGGAPVGRRHHSSHSLRSNIFRINLNGFYSPHPATYSPNPSSFPPQSFYTCHPVHCNRKPERRQCGCSSKFQDTIDNIGFYRGYPSTTSLYHHLPNSYALASPSQFAPIQSQHFFLNPARFHRRRNRLIHDEAMGGEELDSARGSSHLGSGFSSSFSCGCGRSDHKHKHKHRHRHCGRDMEEDELIEEEVEREGFISKQRPGFIYRQEEVGRKASRGLASVRSKEQSWLRENGGDTFSSVAASSTTDRFKQTTSLGMGSTHLSSFGGGWGGLGQSWTKYSGLGGNHSWTGFNSEQQRTSKTVATVREDEEDDEEPSLYRTSPPPGHTNLFTSAAVTGARGLRCGLGIGADQPWRREDPVWMERRETGLQTDSRNCRQHKTVQPPDNGLVNKRRPGRPRKHPLPSSMSPSGHSSSSVFMAPPEVQPGLSPDSEAVRRDSRAEPVLMTDAELQAKRKKGRKRIHSTSPSHQSVTEDTPEHEASTEDHSDVVQAQAQTVPVPREEREDRPPSKTFLKAGLYSDDYKTTDPPSPNHPFDRDTEESSSGEQEYSLLPAPIHVGKYLRLKRIHFQLPYDVMWLWRHNQLCRPPVVPLKRKRHYSRLKDKTLSSHLNADETSGDITNLFPHLDMDLLTSSERSFVVKHHVFLLRNWELVRERQIRLRIERERQRDTEEEDEEEEEEELAEDSSRIKSDQPAGAEVVISDVHKSQDTSSSLTASPSPTKAQDTLEGKEDDKRGEEELCSREKRRKRLNDLLLTLQHS